MPQRLVVPNNARKAVWLDLPTHAMLRNFAREYGMTISEAAWRMIGTFLVELEGGDASSLRVTPKRRLE